MFNGTLLPYQPHAVDRMIERRNQLVAYDMGLGKTVITIAAIEELFEREVIRQPGLVICLSSLKYQWAEAIHKFSDSLPWVIDGPPKKRAEQYAEVLQEGYMDYIIMNYEQVVNDWETVQHLPTGFIVLDEATAIKSFRTKRSRRIKKLAKTAPVRFALTGTPMENGKPEELFSILQFVDPAVLGEARKFDERYIVRSPWGSVERYRNMTELHERVKPVLVRKRQTDPDVAPHLPQAIEPDPILVPFDRSSLALYRKVAADLLADLEEAASLGISGSAFNVMAHYGTGRAPGVGDGDAAVLLGRVGSKLTALRRLCCSVELLKDSDTEYVDSLRADGWFEKTYHHPKIKAVDQFVRDHLEADDRNKAVIFTHWVGMVDLLSAKLPNNVKYTGQMNAVQKETAKKKFQMDQRVRGLVSSDAGGYGVDLPQANMLINYDLADTSGTDAQRRARIKRANSPWPSVIVQDFLMKDSIEERMWMSLTQKSSVQSAVVDGEGIRPDGRLDLSMKSLGDFLRTSPLTRT